ncbi:hypothetical protein NQ318_023065 [Aromia moschata]|uniref:Uncharacterized protein n=1 Tax=Aromia moschata TaxID=1265417 RepID=A0AAV8XYN2_9CUCU|nr:hypothetical protein NQ318_023065 [Aromia moschata]
MSRVELLHPGRLPHRLPELCRSIRRRPGGAHLRRCHIVLRVQALATRPEERHRVGDGAHLLGVQERPVLKHLGLEESRHDKQ